MLRLCMVGHSPASTLNCSVKLPASRCAASDLPSEDVMPTSYGFMLTMIQHVADQARFWAL